MAYRMAVTIAGAVSLGAFEAGVLFELLDALAQHNQGAPPDAICIDVLTGASAGGMTASMVAQTLLYTGAASNPYDNSLYNAWVARVDIEGLLPLGPKEKADSSALSSDFVRKVAAEFLLGRYQHPPPAPTPHPACSHKGDGLRLGLALSNLNGVDYARAILTGSCFDYTRFQDQIAFKLDATADTPAFWTRVADAACACGAFPFAFRPSGLDRRRNEYDPQNLQHWPADPRRFTYTDGGVFQNQPLGMAKNFVDAIDAHQGAESRAYLFVSPTALASKAREMTADSANFKNMAGALVNAIYNQAGFQDWIEAEGVNDAISVLNQRAIELEKLFESGAFQDGAVQAVTSALLPRLCKPEELPAARAQLRGQYLAEYSQLSAARGLDVANAWIDALLVLELAAGLHEKDEMYIYAVTAEENELAGAGFHSFLGFLYRDFREHDYDLGRMKARALLTNLHRQSQGRLPQLRYTPKAVRPAKVGPPFAAAMIPETRRQMLYKALSQSADCFLREMGMNVVVRKAAEIFFLNGKIKQMLSL